MRKGEVAKLKIKRKLGYGRKEDVEELRRPVGWEDGENWERLRTKGIIYEVKLHSWIDREDFDSDRMFVKIYKTRGNRNEWESPKEIDEITMTLLITSEADGKVIIDKEKWGVEMDDP